MDAALKELIQLGALGIVLALAFLYILRKDKAHREILDKHEDTLKSTVETIMGKHEEAISEILERNEKERIQCRSSMDNMFTKTIEVTTHNTDVIVKHNAVIAELSEVIKNRMPR